jgi:hypothetical protein
MDEISCHVRRFAGLDIRQLGGRDADRDRLERSVSGADFGKLTEVGVATVGNVRCGADASKLQVIGVLSRGSDSRNAK